MSIKLEGSKELTKQLNKLAKKAASGAVRKALRAGGNVILKEARIRVPRRTGTLKKSLGIVARKGTRTSFRVSITNRSGKKFKHDGWYAHFLEFGVRSHTLSKKNEARRKHPGHKAKPFMRPAYELKKEAAVKTFRDRMWQEILKASK